MHNLEQRIRTTAFASHRKGYDRSEVDTFLETVADEVAQLQADLRREGVRVRRLERELSGLQIQDIDASGVFFTAAEAKTKLLEAADQQAAAIVAAAKEEAQRLTHEPTAESVDASINDALAVAAAIERAANEIAASITADAQAEAKRIRDDAEVVTKAGDDAQPREVLHRYG
ncbi:MAG: DivIVA domain-containing protein [Acidimicrobiia bacterium]